MPSKFIDTCRVICGVRPRVRYHLDVSPEVARMLEEIARESGCSLSEVMRRALALLKVAHDYKGTYTLGIDSDPSKFDIRVTGIP